MSDRFLHRGPDGSGVWRDRSIGLGHRLLHTTPESLAEAWPMQTSGGNLVLVADARIDNRDELLSVLGFDRAGKITDGALLLAAYEKWGRSAPEKLIGDFAFAVWDATRQAIFCARDPMGVKPFFYYVSDRIFVFASELKGLFCMPEVPRDLDEVQIAYFLDWFRSDQERTMYRDVRRLPASHWLEVDASHVRTGVGWAADPEREIRYSTSEEYVEAFREHFAEAVRCRLRSAFPVGSALSGGLDSSSIVGMARKLMDGDEPLHVIAAHFPGLPEPYRQWNDESRYIDAVAAMEGIALHRVRADERSVFEYLDRMYWYHDAPPFGFMYWMRWAVYEEAARNGVRVFFSGDDGDSVVSHGYERFNDLALEGRWATALAEVEAMGRRLESPAIYFSKAYLHPRLVALARSGRWGRWREGSREVARGFDLSPLRLMSESVFDAFLRERLRSVYRRVRGRKSSPSLVRAEFARRVGLEERKRHFQTVHPDPIPTARESHALVLPSPMLQHIMEVTDSMSSAFAIETRCPFLDRRLIEFSLAIPSEQKLADGWTRLILRRAMEGILPPEVQWRIHKADLSYNFVRRLQNDDRRILDSLFDQPEVLSEYVDMNELRDLHARFYSNGLKGARHKSAHLYIAAVLARWLRARQVDGALEPTGPPV
jgi:asparagine synthase (glutamine-hydrolysing)